MDWKHVAIGAVGAIALIAAIRYAKGHTPTEAITGIFK